MGILKLKGVHKLISPDDLSTFWAMEETSRVICFPGAIQSAIGSTRACVLGSNENVKCDMLFSYLAYT
jgi:hypothetical protein